MPKYFCLALLFCMAIFNIDDNMDKLLSDSEIYSRAHKFTQWFYSSQLDSLSNYIYNKNFTLKDLKDFRLKVENQLGQRKEVINEGIHKFWSKSYNYKYARCDKFSKVQRPVVTIFSFDAQNNIYEFSVQVIPNEAATKYLNYQTKTKLRLPFKGEWYVASGGRTVNYNQHAVASDQRFAYDFLIKKGGITFKNKGKLNSDYFCYEQEILAPGSGVVVTVVNDIAENKPGEMPELAGNHVIIDHENGEYSFLAHLKKGTIVVNAGDRVEIGQYLGLCGNSGHSSEPHLHYHLQNTPVFFQGEGLPAQFQSYAADGKEIEKDEPIYGQYIQSVPGNDKSSER